MKPRSFLLKIDWQNHFVGFVSTLLGIFIAFQLDDWQEVRKRTEHLQTTMDAIKKEVEKNLEIYEGNAKLADFVEWYTFWNESSNDRGELVVSERVFNAYKKKIPTRLAELKLVARKDSMLIFKGDQFKFDVIPATAISTNNFETAKSPGILNFLDHERMNALTEMYNLINLDLGFKESEFYKRNLFGREQFPDIEVMVSDYRQVAKISEFKHAWIKPLFDEMKWTFE